MNQNLIASINNKNVYLVNDSKLPFYICLPSGNTASIVLNLVSDVSLINININNMTSITNEITNIYSKFNFSDVAVVTPIIDSNLLEQVKLNNDENVFLYLDKYMAYLINAAYSFLRSNNIAVNNQIKLDNNDSYVNFNNWFFHKYNGRVVLVDYSNAPVNKFENVSQNNMTSNDIANDVLNNTAVMGVVRDDSNSKVSETKEPGFVSYVLLGVIVAVVSLIVLYMLL